MRVERPARRLVADDGDRGLDPERRERRRRRQRGGASGSGAKSARGGAAGVREGRERRIPPPPRRGKGLRRRGRGAIQCGEVEETGGGDAPAGRRARIEGQAAPGKGPAMKTQDTLRAVFAAAAVAHFNVAQSSWASRRDAVAAAHWARLAQAEARQAQYVAEAAAAQEIVTRETERRQRAELAVREAEIAMLQARVRTEAEKRAAEIEARAAEERCRTHGSGEAADRGRDREDEGRTRGHAQSRRRGAEGGGARAPAAGRAAESRGSASRRIGEGAREPAEGGRSPEGDTLAACSGPRGSAGIDRDASGVDLLQ